MDGGDICYFQAWFLTTSKAIGGDSLFPDSQMQTTPDEEPYAEDGGDAGWKESEP